MLEISDKRPNEIIQESIKKVIGQDNEIDSFFDINNIPEDVLSSYYADYSLIPYVTAYLDPLSSIYPITEQFGQELEADDVIRKISNKYNLKQGQIKKTESWNGVAIYLVIPMVGNNDELIVGDMKKLGYFLSHRSEKRTVNNVEYQILQFEPTSQMQDDITEEVKSECRNLFHWTPKYNINSISLFGLIPGNRNEAFFYPDRVCLISGTADMRLIVSIGKELCMRNTNPLNDGNYELLSIDVSQLKNDIRFFYDPNSPCGVYTEQTIPANCIRFHSSYNFKVKPLEK